MHLLICGDRNWIDKQIIKDWLIEFSLPLKPNQLIEQLVHGNARGADRLGAEVALELGITNIKPFDANWTKFGKAAGPIRNREMLNYLIRFSPIFVVAFHNDIENSKGTKDMISIVKAKGNISWSVIGNVK